jgi:ribosomal protein L13
MTDIVVCNNHAVLTGKKFEEKIYSSSPGKPQAAYERFTPALSTPSMVAVLRSCGRL